MRISTFEMCLRKMPVSSGVPSVRWYCFVTLQETVRSRLLVIVQPLECHSLVILIKINEQVLQVSNELYTTLNAMQIDDPEGKALSVKHASRVWVTKRGIVVVIGILRSLQV